MNGWMKTLIVFLLLFISACHNSEVIVGRQEALQTIVDDVRVRLAATLGKPVPSISVYIETPDAIWFVSSAPSPGERLSEGTYFRFASNTKTFTATAIMKMHQDGWLNIKSLITDTIPGFAIPYVPGTAPWNIPFKNTITIEQLLQHDAGVYDVDNEARAVWGGKSYVGQQLSLDPAHQFTAAELVGQLTLLDIYYFAPGTGNKYSNTGYTILSEIVACVYSARAGSVKTYSDYIYDHIIGGTSPVPLNVIRFPRLAADDTLPAPSVAGYEYPKGAAVPDVYTSWNMSAHVGEGNGYGNFIQLNRFVRTLFAGSNVLFPATVSLMISDISPYTTSYALGCDHVRNLGYGHNGAINGYLSTMRYNPDTAVSLVVLMPLIDGDNLTTCILDGVYSAAWEALRILGYPGRP